MPDSTLARTRQALRMLPEEDPTFQIVPMVDVLLVLLVFFMTISSSQVLQYDPGVRLPFSPGSEPTRMPDKREGLLILNVLWDEASRAAVISIEDRDYPHAAALGPLLAERLRGNPDLQIILRADRKVPYRFIRPVMAAVGAAGSGNLTFAVLESARATTSEGKKKP